MSILLDTNILLRLDDSGSPAYRETREAIRILEAHDVRCVLVPQVLYEFWVAATRPVENNGLGRTTRDADRSVEDWIAVFDLKLDERGIFSHWRSLVAPHDVKGKPAHDARLAAAMLRHGIDSLLTFNRVDFARYGELRIFTPIEIVAGGLPQ